MEVSQGTRSRVAAIPERAHLAERGLSLLQRPDSDAAHVAFGPLPGDRGRVAPAEHADGRRRPLRSQEQVLVEVPEGPGPRVARVDRRADDRPSGLPVLCGHPALNDELLGVAEPAPRVGVAPEEERLTDALRRHAAFVRAGVVAMWHQPSACLARGGASAGRPPCDRLPRVLGAESIERATRRARRPARERRRAWRPRLARARTAANAFENVRESSAVCRCSTDPTVAPEDRRSGASNKSGDARDERRSHRARRAGGAPVPLSGQQRPDVTRPVLARDDYARREASTASSVVGQGGSRGRYKGELPVLRHRGRRRHYTP